MSILQLELLLLFASDNKAEHLALLFTQSVTTNGGMGMNFPGNMTGLILDVFLTSI